MVASARVAYLAHRSADYGVIADVKPKIDMSVVQKRRRDIVNSFRGGSERRIKNTEGLDLFMGKARFSGQKVIEVDLNDGGKINLTGESIFINVGARPSPLKLTGVESVPVLNSTTIMELEEVPDHLLVIGGGYIGLEFGQMFHRYGSKVTIIQRGPYLLGREDSDIADNVAEILRQDGIEILLETTPTKVIKDSNGLIHITVQSADGERVLAGSHLLVAAGRTPNTDLLHLPEGVSVDQHGYIKASLSKQYNRHHTYCISGQ
jgi:pyruvate/2-oxoglutarate dehydrogenase complex dihydrolipoamide dehydrogenase (E3) component